MKFETGGKNQHKIDTLKSKMSIIHYAFKLFQTYISDKFLKIY